MNGPPKRLVDDAGVSPELKGALDQLGREEVPFDVDAGLAKLKSAVAQTPPSPDPTGILRHKLVLGGVAALAGAALVAGIALRSAEPPPPPPAPPAVFSVSEPVETSSVPSTTPSVEVERTPPAPSAAPPASIKAPASKPTLAEEVKQLAEVRALAASNPAAAAARADEGHQRFRGGMLYQEREAVAISALARAGRGGEAQARARRFTAQFPKSPFREQVEAVLPKTP